MRRFTFVLLSALTLALPWGATAEPDREDPLGNDVRLDRRIQVTAEGVPVGDLLAKISAKSGLALRAEAAIADEKVIVLGPVRPVRAVLADIATLFNDNWRHYTNVEGKEQYLLFCDPRAVRYENGLAASVARKIQAQLEEQVAALNESAQQFAKRPENDLIRSNFAKPILHGRSATRLYGLLDQNQKDALFAQGYVNISFSGSRSADQDTVQGAFKEAVSGLEQENARVQQENPDVHVVIDPPENLRRYGVRFNLHHENNGGLSAVVVQVIMGKASYMTMGEFTSKQQWVLSAHGNPYTRKPLPADADLPDAKNTNTASKAAEWVDQLRSLAETSGRPIVADHYRAPDLVKPLPEDREGAGKGAAGALDGLCEPQGYLWWVEGKTVLFRKRDWYQQKLYEPADRWITSLAKKLRGEKFVPTYGDVASLLELTPMQLAGLNNLLAGDSSTPYDADTLAGMPDLLQIAAAAMAPETPVYEGSLTPTVIEQIGLPRAGAPAGARACVASFLTSRRQITGPIDIARFRVCFTAYRAPAATGPDAAAAAPARVVTLIAEWNPGDGQTPFDQQLQLALPTELPNDRYGKTKVEIVE